MQFRFIAIFLISATGFLLIISKYVQEYKYLNLNEVGAYTHGKRDWIREGVIKPERGKRTVLILGDSRLTFGLIPKVIDETAGSTFTVNAANPGNTVIENYYVLKDFISHNYVPDVVILDFSNEMDPKKAVYKKDGSVQEEFYYAQFNDKPVEYFFSSVFAGLNSERITSSFFPKAEIRKDMKTALTLMKAERGHFIYRERENAEIGKDEKVPRVNSHCYPLSLFTETYQRQRKKILELAQEKGIEVIIVHPPYCRDHCLKFEVLPPDYVELKTLFRHVYFLADLWDIKLFSRELMSDVGHVNRKGAMQFSHMVGTSLGKFNLSRLKGESARTQPVENVSEGRLDRTPLR